PRTLREERSVAKEEAVAKVSKADPTLPAVVVAKTERSPAVREKEKLPLAALKPAAPKTETLVAKVDPAPPREGPANSSQLLTKSEPLSDSLQKEPPQFIPAVSGSLDTAFTKI